MTRFLVAALVVAGIATVAIAQQRCTTTCHGQNGQMSTCVKTCNQYGDQVTCNTNCY